jgi:microcystin-dependent protein
VGSFYNAQDDDAAAFKARLNSDGDASLTGISQSYAAATGSNDIANTAITVRPRNIAVMWCIKAWNAPVNQGTIDVAALAKEVERLKSAVPVGAVLAFPTGIVAPGYLELDGSVQSIATYPDLAAFLGTTYNKGNEGSGNFRLPESRGEFLRGWDHGRGADVGRAVGSYQTDELKSHIHQISAPTSIAASGGSTGIILAAGGTLNWSTTNTGGVETRPRNIAVMWCIKAWNAPVNQGNIDIAPLTVLAQQASETNQGTAKVATQTQTLEGTDDSTIVTPKKLRRGLAISLAVNGYIALPNWLGGLIIQWGQVKGATYNSVNNFVATPVTWPIAFPNGVFATTTGIATGITANTFTNTSLENRTNVGALWMYACGVTGNTPVLSYIAIGN